MTMNSISEREVKNLLKKHNIKILKIIQDHYAGEGVKSLIFHLSK